MLSADLRMLQGKDSHRNVPDAERSAEWLSPRLQAAWNNQDWIGALSLLRNGPLYLSFDQIAYLRAQAYEELGHPDIALLFYKYAAASFLGIGMTK